MANNLDNIDFSKLDQGKMIESLERFPELCMDAWNIGKNFALPSYFVKATKFVAVGMGASGISGDIIKSLVLDSKAVVESVHDYKLPGFVDSETIVIISSYSGNTEESLSAFLEAQEKGAKIIAIGSGGKLKLLADKFKAIFLGFELEAAPRAAFPYLFMFLLSIFVRLGFLELEDKDIEDAVDFVGKYRDRFKSSTRLENNQAKILARKLVGRSATIYGSGILAPVARRFKCQLNENSKSFASCDFFPELDHNAIEGYEFPKDDHYIIFLESNYDAPQVIERQNITAQLIDRNKIPLERVKMVPCVNQLAEILTATLFGDFVSYYVGVLNNVQISKNENIDYLKAEMKR